MASEACPVCCLILSVETPARVALVAKPARRLSRIVGSNPAAAIRSRTIKDTASPESRPTETRPCRSTAERPGLLRSRIRRASDRGPGPGSGECPAEGDADLAARPFLVGLRAPERDDDPLSYRLDVVAVQADDFRSPEAAREADEEQRPVARVLRALAHGVQDPEQVLPQQRGLASCWATPRVRLTLRNVARTISDRQGFSSPRASCAFEIVAMRRTSVATLSVSACAAM